MPPRTRKTEEPAAQPAVVDVPLPEEIPPAPESEAALFDPHPDEVRAAQAEQAILNAVIDPLPPIVAGPPVDLPEGFTFNTTGQQWCPACLPGGLHETGTSFACDHGTWQSAPQVFQPPA